MSRRLRTISALAAAVLLPLAPSAAHAAQPTQASAHTTSTPGAAVLSPDQASSKARHTGKAVRVDGATTASSTLDANPDGSFTLTQTTTPVRAKVRGTWKSLDATLTRDPDGSLSPAVSTGSLTLSPGGTGPLAVMRAGTASLALSLPLTLPAPALEGPSATYRGVLPGVDLTVTADTFGGFTEVFAVKNAAAAADPALSSLTFAAKATGVSLSADPAGNISARTPADRTLFTAPAPRMWDSATAAAPTTTAPDGTVLDAHSGTPATSGPTHPGAHAHTAALKVAADSTRITLTPDRALMSGTGVRFPLYIDPSYSAGSSSAGQSWTYVSSMYPTTSYWKTTGDDLHVGFTDWASSPAYVSTDSSFYTENVPAAIDGATINWANAYFPETYAPWCTAEPVQLWRTGAISSATTYNNEPSWISQLGSVNAAHGYSSSCPAADVVYDITSTMASAAAGHWTNLTLGLKSGTSDDHGWKKFSHTATITTNYDHVPATPTTLYTSPNTSPIGNGDVTLYAGVYDPDGGSLGVAFTAYITGHSSEIVASTSDVSGSSTYLAAISGSTASLTIPKATLDADVLSTAYGGSSTNTSLSISWNVAVSDGTLASIASATRSFTFSTATPGQPTIYDATGTTTCPNSTLSYTVGHAAPFTFKPNGGTTTPTSYLYQLNGATPISTSADSTGAATVSLTPTRRTTMLTVTAVAASGNLGQVASCPINAAAPANAADKDLSGDGVPDLLTNGGTGTNQPAGLWLAPGRPGGTAGAGTGQITTTATDIGANGNGAFADQSPTDFTGAQAVTGRFNGNGFQDILTYYPTGTHAGEAITLSGPGDGSIIQAQDNANTSTMPSGTFADTNSDNPLQLANAYNSAASGYKYPDLIGTSGDATNGYYLEYYPNGDGPSSYGFTITASTYNSSTSTYSNLAPPDATTSWNAWTLATTQIGGNTDLILWNKATGHLYLWANFTIEPATDNTGNYVTIYNQYLISTTFDTGASLATLEAVDINNDGIPDLWTVSPTGAITAYLITNLSSSAPATLTAQTAQTLITATHNWELNDNATQGAQASTAADDASGTLLPLTGTAGATWNTGDLFSPDVTLDGTSGSLSTASKAVDLTGSFTISAWAKPTALGGAVLAQGGSADVGMTLFTGNNGWVFSLNTGAGTTNSYDTITGGTVQLGTWTHLTASYNATTAVMNLYVDDVFVATGSHTAPTTGATGGFLIGFDGTRHFTGQIADAHTWSATALAPPQPSSPAGYHQAVAPTRILDTRTSNVTLSNATASTPVAPLSVTTLKISGDAVTPIITGAPTNIPASVTAVAIDVTETAPTEPGTIVAFADGTQVPITSSTNFVTNATVTGYQIVPVGPDGKIALQNDSTGTTHLIVDITGYFTSDPTLTGDQTYIPLTTAYRLFDTAAATTNTSLHATGPVPAGTTFNVQITGVDNIPTTAAAVAINLTAFGQAAGGFLEAYPAGSTQPTAFTSMTYDTTDVASMSADTSLGSSGQITLYNSGGSTDLIGDISGYYITATTGQKYHAVNPTRLVDTRTGVGGTTGPLTANGTYTLTQATTSQITTAATPTLVAMLTATAQTSPGNLIAYPYGTTQPATSNLNWSGTLNIANLALTPESTNGQITLYNQSAGTTHLVIDTSGYFATN